MTQNLPTSTPRFQKMVSDDARGGVRFPFPRKGLPWFIGANAAGFFLGGTSGDEIRRSDDQKTMVFQEVCWGCSPDINPLTR